MSMPGSVKLSLVAVAGAVLSFVGLAALSVRSNVPVLREIPLAALLTLLLGWSILRRKRLAWLWGRWIGFFLAGATVLIGILTREQTASVLGALVVASVVVPFLVVSIAFGRPSAYAWFGMVCPACGRTATRGDFLMRQLRCPGCEKTF